MLRAVLFAIAILTIPSAPGAQASVISLGNGCATPEGIATLGHAGLPTLGTWFTLEYTGPNQVFDGSTQSRTRPVLVIGFSILGGIPIPPELFPLQPIGCELWTPHRIVVPMAEPSPVVCPQCTLYPNSLSIWIPNQPQLDGLPFFAQWLAVHTQCGFSGCEPAPIWIGTSDAAVCTIGV